MTDGGVSFKGLSYFVGIGGYRVIPSIPGSGEQVLSLSVHILLPDDVGYLLTLLDAIEQFHSFI